MIENPGILITVLAFVLVIGPLVFFHELGHYAAGRWFGVKADVFAIGFGREIAGFTDRRGTRWKFGWLPLGGYVKFAGDMNAVSQPSEEWLSLPAAERAQTFQAKTLWQRAIIVAAGPLANFLLAVIIFAGLAMVYGQASTAPVIGTVMPDSAAAAAGLRPGDRITALGDRAIDDFTGMAAFTVDRPGERVTIAYEREGQALSTDAVIGTQKFKDRFGNVTQRGLLGLGPTISSVPFWEAPWAGLRRTVEFVGMMVDGLGQIITGRVPVSELGGPLRIAQMSGQSLAMGPAELIILIALISINLGFINLLPVPVLDGGHLLLYGIEAVRRRPVEPHVMEWAFRGGLVAILALFVLVTFNDLGAFGVWKGLAGLIG